MQRMYTDLSPTASLLTNSENTSISVQTSKLQEAFDFERGQRGVCIQTTGNFALIRRMLRTLCRASLDHSLSKGSPASSKRRVILSSHMAYRDGDGKFFVWPIESLVSLLSPEKLKAFEKREYKA
uniref:Uncharacterized protein n=1 Tax=Ditylenchus dipsaci TaxID=166011 RepID=A0A915CRZ6_9BILA